jgi:UDP-GlcNAc:undecaprenyl-phosphate GlcNAc-1-phosphate transferase
MSEWTLVLFGSLFISLTMVFFAKKFADRINFFDLPDGKRKLQSLPIPKTGGIAVAIGYSIVVLLYTSLDNTTGNLLLSFTVLAPALFASLIGLMDDIRDLSPALRLSLQAASGIFAWILGTRIEVFDNQFLNILIFIFWFMVIVNGINLLDNSDGLAASTVIVSASAATVLAYYFGQELIFLLGLSLIGVTLGFLFFNWEPAKVYLGDSGAYFLGSMLAITLVRLKPIDLEAGVSILIIVLLAILPIMDTSFVVARRIYRGIHPFTAGRDHLSHKLQQRGYKVGSSVLILQIIPIICIVGIFVFFNN